MSKKAKVSQSLSFAESLLEMAELIELLHDGAVDLAAGFDAGLLLDSLVPEVRVQAVIL